MSKPRHQASPAALDLIKRFEGFRGEAARLPDARWTIGYGHTRSAREGAVVSRDDAEALLIYDLQAVAQTIDELVYTPLTQNQFDALASFAFNIGVENFRQSAVLRRINEGAMLEAAFALEIWRKADFEGERIVVDALVRRRAAEKSLFLTPQNGWIAAPSRMIEPKADDALALLLPPLPEEERPINGVAVKMEEGGRSPAEQAAAALAARLDALVPEALPPAAPPEPQPELFAIEAEPQPEPFAIEAEPEHPSEPEPFPEVVEPDHNPDGEPMAFAAAPRARTYAATSDTERLRRSIFGLPESQPKPDLAGLWPLGLLGAAGLAAFGGAMFGAFHAKLAGGAMTALGAWLIAVGVIGILCVASAVYFLLERLGGRDG